MKCRKEFFEIVRELSRTKTCKNLGDKMSHEGFQKIWMKLCLKHKGISKEFVEILFKTKLDLNTICRILNEM